MKATPAIRSPRLCWPTACGWSRAASSITARAASYRPAPRNRRRWCSSKPAATPSRTAGRPRSRCMKGCVPRASMPGRTLPSMSGYSPNGSARCCRPASTTRPSYSRAGCGWRCGSRCCAIWPGSATHPRTPTRRATTSATRIATCWLSAAGRPGWPRRLPPGAAARG